MQRTLALVLIFGSAWHNAQGGQFDWPQWQGPERTAHSKETGLLKEWPKDGPLLAWKTKGLGGGDSGPSIAAGRIYGMSHRGADEIVWALSENDGKEAWAVRIGPAQPQSWPQSKEGPSCTPTVDGNRLYVMGLAGNVACLQVADGKVVWQRSLVADFGGKSPMWSFRESPLVDGNKVICTPGGEETTMVALNKLNGEMIWKSYVPERDAGGETQNAGPGWGAPKLMKVLSALDADENGVIDEAEIKNAVAALQKLDVNHDGKLTEDEVGMKFMGPQNTGAAYSSAIAIDFGGQRQYVQFLAMTVAGVAAADGKLLWRYDKPANGMRLNISTPIYQDGQVFAASAYGAGGGSVRLTTQPTGEFVAEQVWFSKSMENHHGGVILYDGALFGANGGNGGGYLACLDFKTGEVLWNEADPDKRRVTKGSVAFADGRIYYRTEEGPIVLIEPSRKEYIERGRFDQPDRTDKPAWAHPVLANGKLYIRDQDTLYCYDVKAK